MTGTDVTSATSGNTNYVMNMICNNDTSFSVWAAVHKKKSHTTTRELIEKLSFPSFLLDTGQNYL